MFAESSPSDSYIVGCDPGQSIDPTAIAVVRIVAADRPIFQVGHLERLPLNTPYPGIAWRVRELTMSPILRRRCEVVVDYTGVGRPVSDLFDDQGIDHTGVTITAGHEELETERGFYSVPKLNLISRLQALLHDGRLLIQKDLPETPALVAELQDFRATVTDSGRWTFGARSGAHDDLVLALAMACWWGAKSGNASLGMWARLGGHVPKRPPDDELKPGPGEVVVTVKDRVWLHGSNRWLEPGRRVLPEADAALYAQYLE